MDFNFYGNLIMIIDQAINDSAPKKLPIKQTKKKPLGDDAESRYWKSFKVKDHFDGSKFLRRTIRKRLSLFAHHKIQINYQHIFSSKKQQVKKTLQRFRTQINSLAFRQDGRLLAAGHENGQVDVFEIKTKLPLRMFKNFKKPVSALCFSTANQEYLYGGADDGGIKLFDVTSESVVRSIPTAHQDFVRSIDVLQADPYHVLTGSYDNTIKLFDFRAQDQLPVQTFTLEDPIEGLVSIPSTNQFVSVQGTKTILWDLRLSQKVQELNVNQKTISGVKFINGADTPRILTYGLDHQVKMIRPDIFQVVYQYKHTNPLMSADLTQDGQTFIFGDSEGKVVIKRRTHEIEEDEEIKDNDYIPAYLKENPYLKKRIRNFQFFNRGIYQTPVKFDVKIKTQDQQVKLGAYDRLMVQFKYKEALQKALEDKQSLVVVSLCEELIARGSFEVALRGLSSEELDQTVKFIKMKIVNPKYQEACLYMLDFLLDEYPIIERHHDLKQIVSEERQVEEEMLRMKGILSMITNI